VPRAIWSGSISFGLVTIPIKLYNAVSRKTVRFNQLDERTGARIKYMKVSAQDGEEVPSENIVRGFEFAKGQYVTISDDELEAVTPAAQRTIDIEAFVEGDDIDPVLYDGAYYAAPGAGFEKAYRLLVDALAADGRVAIARYVRHGKQHLVALRPQDGRLVMSNLVWADEVVSPADIDEFEGLESVKLTDAELSMADQLIESLAADFEPDRYRDTYREELVDLLNRKAAGEELVVTETEPADDAKVVDLLAALEASVAAAKAARAEPGGAGAESDADEGGGGGRASARRSTAKKAPAKKKAAPRKKKAATAKTAQKRKSA
jgi:DNA end-binding protein Ku